MGSKKGFTMDGKTIKGQFLWKSQEEQKEAVRLLRQKIASGYFFKNEITQELVRRISPHFDEQVETY
jgi:hypothetical protein